MQHMSLSAFLDHISLLVHFLFRTLSYSMAEVSAKKRARTGGAHPATTETAGSVSAEPAPTETASVALMHFRPVDHAGMLGLSVTQPKTPTMPSEFAIMSGEAASLKSYMANLVDSVWHRLSVFLFEHPQVQLRLPLWTLRTPEFVGMDLDGSEQHGMPTGYKEPWDLDHSIKSLKTSEMYESSITVWQLDIACVHGFDSESDAVQWQQYVACGDLWSKARLVASSPTNKNKRFIYEGFIPSAVLAVDEVKRLLDTGTFFRNLPVGGGHAQLWSLIGALHEALEQHAAEDALAGDRIMRLFEASVNVTCRMRLSPTKGQMQLDQLGHMDLMRVLQVALGSVSFHQFAMRVLALPKITSKETGNELIAKLEELGVTFKGKPIDRNLAYGILSLVGVFDTGEGLEAFRFLDRVDSSVMAESYKIVKVIQTLKKLCTRDEWVDGAVAITEGMAVAMLSGDKTGDVFSSVYVVPLYKAPGFAHACIYKMKFTKWFVDDLLTQSASGACTGLSVEGITQIKSHCHSDRQFWILLAAKAEIVEDPSYSKYVAEKFAQFKDSLTCDGDKHAADLMLRVMTNEFYDDFLEIAASGAKFSDHFAGDADGAPDDGLHAAICGFRASLITAPIPSTKPFVDFDAAFANAEDSEHVRSLYHKVTAARKSTVSFIPLDYKDASAWVVGGLAAQAFQKSRCMRSTGDAGKEHTMIMLNPELFPNDAAWQKSDLLQPVALSDSMNDAAKWACASRLSNGICLLSDGRARLIRRAFEAIAEAHQTDDKMQYDGQITYSVPPKNDPRCATTQSFASLKNRETLIGTLPLPRSRMPIKKRKHYNGCDEKNTEASTYSNAKMRRWDSLPRLGVADKESMVGATMPTYPDDLGDSLKTGHPLFMHEMKEMPMYCALFEDMNVTHVFDLAAGSGAAAMAAAVLGINYEGLVMNAEHANWLDRIMDKAMFAIVADGKDRSTEAMAFKQEVKQYFSSTIDEAKLLMKSGADSDDDDEDDDAAEGENQHGES